MTPHESRVLAEDSSRWRSVLADHEETPSPNECSVCGIELGEGLGKCRPAKGTTEPTCLDCAVLYDPPTSEPESPEYDA